LEPRTVSAVAAPGPAAVAPTVDTAPRCWAATGTAAIIITARIPDRMVVPPPEVKEA
jgi:hypothetical protein